LTWKADYRSAERDKSDLGQVVLPTFATTHHMSMLAVSPILSCELGGCHLSEFLFECVDRFGKRSELPLLCHALG
jgi:hypothetical protein